MEQSDRDLLMKYMNEDERLRELYQDHMQLEKKVVHHERHKKFSATTALRQKELKIQKLKGMDEIMSILETYRMRETIQ